LTPFQTLGSMVTMNANTILKPKPSESVAIFKESLIASIETLIEEDKEGKITAQSILAQLKNGDL
jgi:hypothetical protein